MYSSAHDAQAVPIPSPQSQIPDSARRRRGEGFDAFVDLSYGESEYTEDCPVCCRPISLSLRLDDEGELEDLGVDRE